MSIVAEIALFIFATLIFAATLALAWVVWKAFAPAMATWAKVAVLLVVILPPGLAFAGANDHVALAVIAGYTATVAGFSLTQGLRK